MSVCVFSVFFVILSRSPVQGVSPNIRKINISALINSELEHAREHNPSRKKQKNNRRLLNHLLPAQDIPI
jgi:hypothetical protein